MTKQNLEILEFEDKKTKAGKRYTRFKTDQGWMSCFDSKSIESLKENEGQTVSVDIMESGDFKNIKKFLGDASDEEESEDNEPVKEKKASNVPVMNKFDSFPVSMKVSYAKDLICQKGMTTEEAVKIVKDLEEAFKPEVPKVIRNFRKEIVKYLQRSDEKGVMEADLIVALKATKEEIDASVKMLLEEGICYEPSPEKIRFLG